MFLGYCADKHRIYFMFRLHAVLYVKKFIENMLSTNVKEILYNPIYTRNYLILLILRFAKNSDVFF